MHNVPKNILFNSVQKNYLYVSIFIVFFFKNKNLCRIYYRIGRVCILATRKKGMHNVRKANIVRQVARNSLLRPFNQSFSDSMLFNTKPTQIHSESNSL